MPLNVALQLFVRRAIANYASLAQSKADDMKFHYISPVDQSPIG
jgi:hypothetical protein